jgi:hypothetical protein
LPTNILYSFLIPKPATCPAHSKLHNSIAAVLWGGSAKRRCLFIGFPPVQHD